jgi:periplasmic protein TonB
MSLLPLVLTHISARAVPVADTRGASRYDPGSGHRPLVALVAVGVPAALLVAVALSPFELPRVIQHGGTIFIPMTAPTLPPPPADDAAPDTNRKSVITAPDARIRPLAGDPVEAAGDSDLPATDPGPIAGSGSGPLVVEPVLPIPPLIPATLDPRFAAGFQPDYPASEQRREVEGTARVRVLVGTDGRVKAVEDGGATSPGFFAETRRQALNKWRFKPAMRGGVAEESWFTITVRFQLND